MKEDLLYIVSQDFIDNATITALLKEGKIDEALKLIIKEFVRDPRVLELIDSHKDSTQEQGYDSEGISYKMRIIRQCTLYA